MGISMQSTICLFLFAVFVSGCLSEPPPLPPQSSEGPAVYQDEDSKRIPENKSKNTPIDPVNPTEPIPPINPGPISPGPTNPPAVTFTNDIVPLLSSNEAGRIFKCTVCHRAYTDYETMASSETLGRILPKVLPGGNMPLNGDKMSSKDIQLLMDWQNLGFPR